MVEAEVMEGTMPIDSVVKVVPEQLYVPHPTFADHDLDNVFEIYSQGELNADLGGRQLLYGDRYFQEMVIEMMLKEGSSPYNHERYDGYMYYQEMPWAIPDREGAARGMF